MSFQITTVYRDGRIEVRDATPEEIAQREADQLSMQAEEEARQQAIAEAEATRQAGLAKLVALGLTEAEAQAIVG